MMRPLLPLLAAAALAACGGVAPIPETTYYRLPPPVAPTKLAVPVTPRPIVVDAFIADGLHNQQAMLYALDDAGTQLRSYHYQLWSEPPSRMLQRRLIASLRASGAAGMVIDRLPPNAAQLRVQGLLTHFERLRGEHDVPTASFGVQMRVESPDRGGPWLLREYRSDVVADDPSIEAYVAAMAVAVDRVFAEFIADFADTSP